MKQKMHKRVIVSLLTREQLKNKEDAHEVETDAGGLVGVTDTRTGINVTVGMCYEDEQGNQIEGKEPHICIRIGRVVKDENGQPKVAVLPVFAGSLTELVTTAVEASLIKAKMQEEADQKATIKEDPLSKLTGPTRIAG